MNIYILNQSSLPMDFLIGEINMVNLITYSSRCNKTSDKFE